MKHAVPLRRLTAAAFCIALCTLLPLAFHAVPNAGNVFSPMHIPVLLCGLMCGGWYGLLCGLAGPLISALLTGMPGAAYLPSMMVELAAYGLIAGVLIQVIRTKHTYVNLYAALLVSMLAGRVIAGLAQALMFAPGAFTLQAWAAGYFITSLPGIGLQLLLIPSLVFTLMRAKVMPPPGE